MSSKRKVTLKLTTQKDLIHAESDARTFGELKKDLKDVKWTGMRVVERESKVTFQVDEAVLPAGDFTLFLVPEKVKSGKEKVKKLKNIATASYNELRSHASQLNKLKDAQIAMNGGTEVLRGAVQAYYDSINPAKTGVAATEENDAIAVIENARAKINEAIDTILVNAKAGPVEDTTEYLVKVSVDDLETEIKSIKSALNL